MSDLSFTEKMRLERLFAMGNGYVLNFSNKTFAEFIYGSKGANVYDAKYSGGGDSKANRLRTFWDVEPNHVVGKLLDDILQAWDEVRGYSGESELPEEYLHIVQRLKGSTSILDLASIIPNPEDKSFEVLARSVRESIEKNEPEAGLDRLHTYLVKYFRFLCRRHGIEANREKPLHSLVGEYIKKLKSKGLIESVMTERILKSSISTLEAFNKVRNEHSFAHDNEVLNYNESLLIFSHVTSSIRFIETLENRGVSSSLQTPASDGQVL